MVALPLDNRPEFEEDIFFDESIIADPNWHNFKMRPFASIGVAGFPWEDNVLIFKLCSIASLPQSSEPFFFIDGKTKPGMSGSPCFLVEKTSAPITFYKETFVGIYSGRVIDGEQSKDLSDLDIGIVWSNSIIEEILKT